MQTSPSGECQFLIQKADERRTQSHQQIKKSAKRPIDALVRSILPFEKRKD